MDREIMMFIIYRWTIFQHPTLSKSLLLLRPSWRNWRMENWESAAAMSCSWFGKRAWNGEGWPARVNLLCTEHSYGKSPSLMGKYAINGPFSIVMLNYQRVYMFWLVVWNMIFMTFHILGMSSSQLTNSYFSEG